MLQGQRLHINNRQGGNDGEEISSCHRRSGRSRKSTIAKLAAEELDYIYIDTGAMYRSVAWKFLQSKQDFSPELVSKLAAEMTITFKQEAKLNRVLLMDWK